MIHTSIIIPAFNYGRYLAESVRSALAQSDPDCEVIVVDDGSTDDTGSVAESFGERIRLIRQANAGLSAARNTGIAAARGELLVFLDADDTLMPHAVETMRRTMDSRGGAYGIIACSHEEMDAAGNWIQDMIQCGPAGQRIEARDIILRSRFCTTLMARRECFAKAGMFDTTLRACEDRDMWIRIASAGWSVFVLPDKLLRVRRHGANMSAAVERQTNSIRIVLDRAYRSSVVSRWNISYWSKVWAVYHYQKSSMLWNAGQHGAAFRHVCWSVLLHPVFLNPAEAGRARFFRAKRILAWLPRVIGLRRQPR